MKKILLIEDDRVMRENTAEILGLAQYEVVTAEDGKKGIQTAKEFSPDLIVCDIMMPKLDGYGVLHILSKDPETTAIPFIFLTAKAEKSELRKGMELGADDYLTKPFEETELLNAIESRLKKNELIRKEFLRNVTGLNQFLDEARGLNELNFLSHKNPVIHYKKKEVLFHEGDTSGCLFFLNRGKVKTFKIHDDGKEFVTGLYKDGDFFGYIPLLENSVYSDSAVTLDDCEICKILKNDFISLVYKNRDIANTFIKMLSNNIVESERKLLSLAYDTVRKRVAEALLVFAKHFSKKGKNIRVSVVRDDLAALAATTTETAIRCLSDFKMDNLIEIEGRDIIILNAKGLEEIF